MLYRGEQKKSFSSRLLYGLNYWLVLFILLLGNVVLSFTLIPIFVIADELSLAFFLVILGLAFGLFTDIIIYHIEKVKDNFYAVIIGFLPLLVLANFFVVTVGSNLWAAVLNLPQGIHSPIFVCVLYVLAYMVPFFYHMNKLYGEGREEAIVG